MFKDEYRTTDLKSSLPSCLKMTIVQNSLYLVFFVIRDYLPLDPKDN